MSQEILIIIYLIAAALFIFGIKQLSKVKTARRGNFTSALGMLIAIIATLLDQNVVSYELIIVGLIIGSIVGSIMALKVQMTAMPQMVALLNGFGGGASLLVAMADFYKEVPSELYVGITIFLSILIGGVTLTGSIVAFGKLQGIITEKAVVYPLQHPINFALLLIAIILGILFATDTTEITSVFQSIGWEVNVVLITIAILSLILGVLIVIPIGGADMPVVISLLNSYSGIAAAMTGFVLNNAVLIITGSLVGASGIILTDIMCKGMNRSLINVMLGGFGSTTAGSPVAEKKDIVVKEVGSEELAMMLDGANNVIIVPGYGMAVAQAQHVVKELMDELEKRNVNVRFAIHPVAGRMPGHMNVLLAEAAVPYDRLYEMDQINDEFSNCDVALVIGANDVTNPAARSNPNSPIYGMPILNVDKAKTAVVIKRSLRPGYAGIDNELYGYPNCLMYFGDAKEAISKLIQELKAL
ncbi:MAG: NAD(P)(+) transhydrogenase (Re/Si-specific) subunit beta [Leptospiraceae bacterium]|nr:NAD(P)(+) transhydrogenase (Re/Si-specific) subunit beta [Leptospiraceae bacterium]MDW7976871.1 NAD(P)(+) transhydrogenase (Re/Si-specific) subunit beta [Leptospiraceae bacterium]